MNILVMIDNLRCSECDKELTKNSCFKYMDGEYIICEQCMMKNTEEYYKDHKVLSREELKAIFNYFDVEKAQLDLEYERHDSKEALEVYNRFKEWVGI